MTTTLEGALRRVKPEKRKAQLAPRPDSALVRAADLPLAPRPALVPDTNVYIANAAGRLSERVASLVHASLQFHVSVCLAEIAVGIAHLDPQAPALAKARAYYARIVGAIPRSRLLVPDEDVWVEAGVIAGTLARTQNLQPSQRQAMLNDALIFLTAAKAGLPVLTADRDGFDLIQQLAPRGRFVFY